MLCSLFSVSPQVLAIANIPLAELELGTFVAAGSSGEVIRAEYHGTPVVLKRLPRAQISEVRRRASRRAARLSFWFGLVRFLTCLPWVSSMWRQRSHFQPTQWCVNIATVSIGSQSV